MKIRKEKDFIVEVNDVEKRPLSASDLAEILIKKSLIKEEDILE